MAEPGVLAAMAAEMPARGDHPSGRPGQRAGEHRRSAIEFPAQSSAPPNGWRRRRGAIAFRGSFSPRPPRSTARDRTAPLRESDLRCRPISPYGAAKLASEGLLLGHAAAYGSVARCQRYFNVYGPRQDPASPYSGVISIFAREYREGRPVTIHGDGEQTRDFISVHDVARANLLAATRPGAFLRGREHLHGPRHFAAAAGRDICRPLSRRPGAPGARRRGRGTSGTRWAIPRGPGPNWASSRNGPVEDGLGELIGLSPHGTH